MTKKKRPKALFLIVLAGLFGTVTVWMAVDPAETPATKMRPDTAAGRREFVRIMAEKMPGIRTEGGDDQGLVIDLINCTPSTLLDTVHNREIADRLKQFDFAWVRCPNGVRAEPPW